MNQIQVGRVSIPLETAAQWVTEYTDPMNSTAAKPYAYPAYDTYQGDQNDPLRLTDADLLAPVLLNVSIKIRSYYALQRARPILEDGLSNADLSVPLAEIEDPERIAAMVGPLYAILDNRTTKPWGIYATKLSKILHRKRPQSLVLHDKWVRRCYVGEDGPVPPSKDRSWADYMVAITHAIGHDIRTQQEAFDQLDRATGRPGELTHVRLLDIVAWSSKHLPAT